jgi:hypothetical protein
VGAFSFAHKEVASLETERSTTYRAPVQLTVTPLGANVTTYYPSASGQDRLGGISLFGHINGYASSDKGGTLTLEESETKASWSTVGSAATVTANVLAVYGWSALTKRYWRWKYVNGADAQGAFKLMEDKAPAVNGVGGATVVTATGNVAHDAVDSGNPVKIGGKASTSQPANVDDGDRVNAWFNRDGTFNARLRDANGNTLASPTGAAVPAGALAMGASDGTNLQIARVSALVADGASGALNGLLVRAVPGLYNGATTDAQRNNTAVTLLASAARTETTSSAVITNYNGSGAFITLKITANPGGAETLTIKVRPANPVDATTNNPIATLVSIATENNTYRLMVSRGASTTPETTPYNKSYALPLPRSFVVEITHSSTGSWTYSLGLDLLTA